MHNPFFIRYGFLLFVLIISFSSCSKNDMDMSADSPLNLASISAFNAIPGSNGFDVFIDNARINNYSESFAVGSFMNYRSVFPGSRTISIVRPGTNLNSAVLSKSLSLKEKTFYTLMLIGNDKLEYLLSEDALQSPKKGKISIRFVHLSPDSPDLSLKLSEDNPEDFSKLTYKSVSKFVELDAGNQSGLIYASNLNFEPIGFNYNFLDQGIYTVYVTGLANTKDKAKVLSYSIVKY